VRTTFAPCKTIKEKENQKEKKGREKKPYRWVGTVRITFAPPQNMQKQEDTCTKTTRAPFKTLSQTREYRKCGH